MHLIYFAIYYSCKELEMEYLYLGPVPYEEDCVQVNSNTDYVTAMKAEIRKYISLLETRFPDAPENAFFTMKSEHHDFGPYYEAVVKYDENDENACKYAFCVESNLPARWDDEQKIDWKAQVLEEV